MCRTVRGGPCVFVFYSIPETAGGIYTAWNIFSPSVEV